MFSRNSVSLLFERKKVCKATEKRSQDEGRKRPFSTDSDKSLQKRHVFQNVDL